MSYTFIEHQKNDDRGDSQKGAANGLPMRRYCHVSEGYAMIDQILLAVLACVLTCLVADVTGDGHRVIILRLSKV
jgi:hypothetical protein